MEGVVELVKSDIASIRTGRAAPALVQDIVITTYGGSAKLKVIELGSITAPDLRSLVITPWDKSTINDIKKGIEVANVGLHPVADADVVRINLPTLTAEDRQNFIRLLHQKLENSRIMLRRVRQDAMEEVKKAFEAKEFGEDERFAREDRIQKLTDEYVSKIDTLGKQKQGELLTM